MENLQQIVLQETTAPFVRALAQYGTDLMPQSQVEVIYSELSDDDKAIWDAFVTMIKSKN
jgi:hypothetical protein